MRRNHCRICRNRGCSLCCPSKRNDDCPTICPTGPAGAPGERGEPGPQGVPGDVGPCCTGPAGPSSALNTCFNATTDPNLCTSSTQFTDLLCCEITTSEPNARVLVFVSFTVLLSMQQGAGNGVFRILVDGTDDIGARAGTPIDDPTGVVAVESGSIVAAATIAVPGTHTFCLQWRVEVTTGPSDIQMCVAPANRGGYASLLLIEAGPVP